jgi:hypothetical protein
MRSIFKYRVPLTDRAVVMMPRGAQVLSVQEQAGELTAWALVNSEQAREPVVFRVCGTGGPAEDVGAGYFISTVQMGGFVWHIFRESDGGGY